MTDSKLEEVKKLVKEKTKNIKDQQHSWQHLQRVAEYAKKIVKSLMVEGNIDLNLLLAACYLHDINHVFYAPSLINYFLEPKRLKATLPKVLSELKIDGYDRIIIENAIYSGSFSFPFKKLNRDKNLYTKILQDADTIDFFSSEREVSFKKMVKDFRFYSFLGMFSKQALKFGRTNLGDYLNFPQLAEESYV